MFRLRAYIYKYTIFESAGKTDGIRTNEPSRLLKSFLRCYNGFEKKTPRLLITASAPRSASVAAKPAKTLRPPSSPLSPRVKNVSTRHADARFSVYYCTPARGVFPFMASTGPAGRRTAARFVKTCDGDAAAAAAAVYNGRHSPSDARYPETACPFASSYSLVPSVFCTTL